MDKKLIKLGIVMFMLVMRSLFVIMYHLAGHDNNFVSAIKADYTDLISNLNEVTDEC